MPQQASRVVVIEGRRVLMVDRTPPIPPTLDRLLATMVVTHSADVRPGGARSICLGEQDHRLRIFREGRHVGLDGVVRDLRLLMCADCESVCVRDVTRDTLSRLPTGRQPLKRRDHVIGWYSGARPGQRVYL
jgi:hypothetical protein